MSQTPSKACCETPPIISDGYKEKGSYTNVAGMKTYTTGPDSAKRGLLVIYDIFGFFPQTLQGADILAYSNKEREHKVFMPDFFDGKPADISWYPPDTDEKGKKLGEFFQTTAEPSKAVERVGNVMKELQSSNPGIQSWGVIGYCWGGKIVNLTSQSGTVFKAAAACHPAMVDPEDAPKITIPICVIPSEGEDKETCEDYRKKLTVKNQVEYFQDQLHGFMAARSDLKDNNVKQAYEKAYQILLTFFHENMDGNPSAKL